MIKNVSGQYVYFTFVSALSGSPMTGLSGLISGRKSLDGLSGMIVLSGNVIELGGGSYRANLYDFDTNGNQVGFLFTSASATVPVQYHFDMIDGNGSGHLFLGSGSITSGLIASGIVFPASGAFVNVPPATLSGVVANSGIFVTVPIATISGVQPISGTFVSVPPVTLSGVVANSGIFASVPIATLSGVVVNSGVFVTVPISSISGNVSNSGLFVVAGSGVNATVPIASVSGVFTVADVRFISGSAGAARQLSQRYATSLAATIDDTNAATTRYVFEVNNYLSGDSQVTYAGQVFQVVTSSGNANLGFLTAVRGTAAPNSGRTQLSVYPGLPLAPLSGDLILALGVNPYSLTSGGYTAVQSGQLSGQQVTLTSGQSFVASGINVTVPIASISGVQPISGATVTVPISSISGLTANSGLFVTVLPANLSGVVANSGIFATVPIATISGVQPISGTFVTVPKATLSGVVANSGLFVTATATVDPATISGVFATVPIATISGLTANSGLTVSLASGTTFLASGSITSGVINSGIFVNAATTVASGISVIATIYSGQLSGQFVTPQSGATFLASGSVTSGVFCSGQFVNAATTVASGLFVNASLNSGQSVLVYSGQLSGQFVTPQSGTTFLASGSVGSGVINSGVYVTVPPATLSGVMANSGIFASVPPATLSGVVANSGIFATVPTATLSGIQPISGTFVTVPIASISGVQPISGTFVSVPTASVSGVFATVPPATLSGVVANSGIFASVLPATLSGLVVNSGLTVSLISGTIGKEVLTYAMSGLTAYSGQRNLLNAARKLTNKWSLSDFSGRLAVYQEDDSTLAYWQDYTSVSGGQPLSSLDTN